MKKNIENRSLDQLIADLCDTEILSDEWMATALVCIARVLAPPEESKTKSKEKLIAEADDLEKLAAGLETEYIRQLVKLEAGRKRRKALEL
ncbi:MAG: hypothetical protein GY832_30865 [Chloroflexi bacterium]|nr:hypothetical protein [Chloroflexota bacterium]